MEMSSGTEQDLASLLQLMAGSQITVLNQTAYTYFKTLKSKQNQIDVAKSLCEGGDVVLAAKAFHLLSKALFVLTKEKKMEEEDLNAILEKICDFKGRASNQKMLHAIDLIAVGIERLCENGKLAISEKHRQWLRGKLELRGHHQIAEKVLPSRKEKSKRAIKKLPCQRKIPAQIRKRKIGQQPRKRYSSLSKAGTRTRFIKSRA